MKKVLFLLTVFFIGFLTSCTQEEYEQGLTEGEQRITLKAQLPIAATRSMPAIPEGYQLRCILEVYDQNKPDASALARIEKVATTTGSTLDFEFAVDAGVEYQCLLWADYIATTAAKSTEKYEDCFYDTSSLKEIGYKKSDATLFNNAACDGFCGVVGKNGASASLSVTLERPFMRLALKDDSDYIKDCTGLKAVTFNTFSGYNVATGEATKKEGIDASNVTIDVESKTWFSMYLFAPKDKSALDEPITMTVTKEGSTEETKVVEAGQITLDANKENTASGDFTQGTGNLPITLTVDFATDYEKEKVTYKLGDFLLKNGTTSSTYTAEAIGIIYALAGEVTDNCNYGVGKKPAAYAMSLSSLKSILKKTGNMALEGLQTTGICFDTSIYDGFDKTDLLLQAIENANLVGDSQYTNWVTTNNPSAENNLSSWYIPSARQLLDYFCLIFGYEGDVTGSDDTTNWAANPLNVNEAIKTAYDSAVSANGEFDLTVDNPYYMSSSVKDTNRAYGVGPKKVSGKTGVNRSAGLKSYESQHILPAITIFE